MAEVAFGGKFNNKIGHAIPFWQMVVQKNADLAVGWGRYSGQMFEEIGVLYEPLCSPEIKAYETEEDYLAAGYTDKVYEELYEMDIPFVRPVFEPKDFFGVPYVTTNFKSVAPERSLKRSPALDLNVKVVNLDEIRTDMVTLHQIIDGAMRHYGVNSGPAWIAATVGTPVTLLEFDENRTDWSFSPQMLTRNPEDERREV